MSWAGLEPETARKSWVRHQEELPRMKDDWILEVEGEGLRKTTFLTGGETNSENISTPKTFTAFWATLAECWPREEKKRSIFPGNIWCVCKEPHEIYNIFFEEGNDQ